MALDSVVEEELALSKSSSGTIDRAVAEIGGAPVSEDEDAVDVVDL